MLRLHTDTHHEVGSPVHHASPSNVWVNGIFYAIELGTILLFTTAAGIRRAGRSFCENCDSWKRQDIATFPPGNGQLFAQLLQQGQLARLVAIPSYIPTGRSKPATLIAIERCDGKGSSNCPVYLAIKDVKRGAAASASAFDGSIGKLHLRRTALTPQQIADLTGLFPNLSLKHPAESCSAARASLAPSTALVEVQPLMPTESHTILTKASKTIGNLLSLLILLVFYGALAGAFGSLYWSGVSNALHTHRVENPGQLVIGLLAAAASLALLVFTGYVGLKNSGVMGNRYFRHLALKAIAQRCIKWVDPERTNGMPTYFVQLVPRQNWGKLMWETATDTGFLQINAARREIRFEGDVERMRIPLAAISNCALASYSASAGNSRIDYWVVVIQGQGAQGPWEAPFSLRQTNWLAPSDHRRRTAQEILDQILAAAPELFPQEQDYSPDETEADQPPTGELDFSQ